ncbi:MAG: DUF3801 domain-containing protein [Oscillospiraceae bacterium]|nr:DUF3801 domain-containing protein [Oscillospiraceae bacterium]
MSYTSDAADEVIRVGTKTVGTVLRIAGNGTKMLASMLYYAFRNRQEDSGVKRMADMLDNGRQFRSFAVRDEDIDSFCREARNIGLRYTMFRERKEQNGITYFLVDALDAARTARTMERIGLGDTPPVPEKKETGNKQVETPEDTRLDLEYFVKKITEKEEERSENPTLEGTEEYLSVPSSELKETEDPEIPVVPARQKPSVRAKLALFRKQEKENDLGAALERFGRASNEQRNKRGKDRFI